MSYLRKLLLFSLCINFSYASVIFSKSDDLNYEFVQQTVEEDLDDYGNTVFKTIYKIIDPLKSLSEKFEKIKSKLASDQKAVFDDANDKISEFKDFRDYDLKSYQDSINSLNAVIRNKMSDMEEQRAEIEEEIEAIKDIAHDDDADAQENTKLNEIEYKNKFDALKERKYYLTALMTQHCDDCNDIIREYQIDVQLEKIDNDIIELEQNFLKQAEDNKKNLKELNAEKSAELNLKYLKLVDILKSELNEYKKKEQIDEVRNNIIDEWKQHAENIENVYIGVQSKIENLLENSLDFDKVFKANEDTGSENSKTFQQDNFKWVNFEEMLSPLPKNAVLGGSDIDDVPLYVIRSQLGENYIYGKYAHGEYRKHAYATDSLREHGVTKFEILTANDYSWCSSYSSESYNSELPICRASYLGSITPGTLLKDMTCRIGFSYSIEIINEDFEILSLNGCSK